MITEYVILQARIYTELEKEVNKLIKTGWKPQGGIAIDSSYDVQVYYQAMIKHESHD